METKRKKLVSLALLSALTSAGVHLYLTYEYYGLRYGFSNASLCNINEKFNCAVASTSSFADIFGVPLALLGLITNLILALFTFNGFISSSDSNRPYRYGYYLSVFVFFVSIVMGAISTIYLTSYCPFCLGTYLLSVLGLASYHFSFTKDPNSNLIDDIKNLFKENKPSLYLLAAIPLIGLFVNWNIQKRFTGDRLDLFIQESISIWKQRKEFTFDQNKGLLAGNPDAKFTIVEFADYLCPHCKTALQPLKTFIAGHQNVKLIFKPYPLDGACNPGMGPNSIGNGIRCRLSNSVYCAEKEFKQGWDYHEFIFSQQEKFMSIAIKSEIDDRLCEFRPGNCDALKKCMDSDEATNWVKEASKEGNDSEVTGTPTVFVNGKKLDGGTNLMVLKSLYKELKL